MITISRSLLTIILFIIGMKRKTFKKLCCMVTITAIYAVIYMLCIID
jgi:hypothetical protein